MVWIWSAFPLKVLRWNGTQASQMHFGCFKRFATVVQSGSALWVAYPVLYRLNREKKRKEKLYWFKHLSVKPSSRPNSPSLTSTQAGNQRAGQCQVVERSSCSMSRKMTSLSSLQPAPRPPWPAPDGVHFSWCQTIDPYAMVTTNRDTKRCAHVVNTAVTDRISPWTNFIFVSRKQFSISGLQIR